MIMLFKSDGCPACHQVLYDLMYGDWANWASHVKIVDVKFSEEEQCFKAYIDGQPTEGKSPVDAVPALYLIKEEKLFQGYQEIKRELNQWLQVESD